MFVIVFERSCKFLKVWVWFVLFSLMPQFSHGDKEMVSEAMRRNQGVFGEVLRRNAELLGAIKKVYLPVSVKTIKL
jgi:hypothetical protein